MEELNVSLIIERLKFEFNEKTDKGLCEELEIPTQTISNWKKRNSIPFEVLFDISQKYNLSLDWLTTGKEKTQALKATEKMLLTAFNELDDKQQLQAVVFVGNLAQGGGASGQSGSIMTVNNSQADNIANGSITIGR